MVAVHLKNVAFQIILYALRTVPVNSDGRCIAGAFFLAFDRNIVEEHALGGHVIANVTVKEPIQCFKACRLDCRCISFNYQPSGSKSNCQLNEENRYTALGALQFKAGWNYYDLAIEYGTNSDAPSVDCQNGCCASNPCLNGGTCHERCDFNGKRFFCECGPRATGTLCETKICVLHDWISYQNSCFKLFSESMTWTSAQKSCERINSNLASIHSAEENAVVHNLTKKSGKTAWIGLTNLNSIGLSYEWVDGSNLSFTNWRLKEPSYMYQDTSENCTEILLNGEWNDLNQNRNLTYVCSYTFSP
ncbi:neurocan core protein-like [Acropora muricata]|uniref:neurocan core protein-like n=1 Tax=Acropora millepora TaxID=45264 RepID=UPI001CF3DD5C|nr:neurocan core protein-like [Acropora millepora]XP_044163506.1 neurocan core protein-like [Acropora millepora]